jgi:hypothetical protein
LGLAQWQVVVLTTSYTFCDNNSIFLYLLLLPFPSPRLLLHCSTYLFHSCARRRRAEKVAAAAEQLPQLKLKV